MTVNDSILLFSGEIQPLGPLSKIHFQSPSFGQNDVYFFIMNPGNQIPPKKAPPRIPDVRPKFIERLITAKWSAEDREQLKKVLLSFGYGRWKKIQEMRLDFFRHKSVERAEIQGFASSFIRCLIDNIEYEKRDLKKFLYEIVQDKSLPYVLTTMKDWDMTQIRQRASPWAKRIQLLYRLRQFIKRFKGECRSRNKPVDWNKCLSNIPQLALVGQKPSVWWTYKHDVDLILWTYNTGYANYQMMKTSPSCSLSELDNPSSFQEFPNSDQITRRLKKIITAVEKYANIPFDLDFQEDEMEGLSAWSPGEMKEFLKFLTDHGVPLSDGKLDYTELLNKFNKVSSAFEETPKTTSQVEKMVQNIRFLSQGGSQGKEVAYETLSQHISQADATQCVKNMNLLSFIRKSILSGNASMFRSRAIDLAKSVSAMDPAHPAYVTHPGYVPEIHDLYSFLYGLS